MKQDWLTPIKAKQCVRRSRRLFFGSRSPHLPIECAGLYFMLHFMLLAYFSASSSPIKGRGNISNEEAERRTRGTEKETFDFLSVPLGLLQRRPQGRGQDDAIYLGCAYKSLHLAPLASRGTFFYLIFCSFKCFSLTHAHVLLRPLIWISADTSSGFKVQSGLPYLHWRGKYDIRSMRSTSGATPADLLMVSWLPAQFPTYRCQQVRLELNKFLDGTTWLHLAT